MNIYIMTRGRVDAQHTWEALPQELLEKTFLVCPPEEVNAHRARGRNVLPSPGHVKNYSDKFRWILYGIDDGCDKIVIMDDDLKFSIPYIREDGERRLRTITDPMESVHITEGFGLMEALLDTTALVGFAPRQMGHTKKPPYEHNGKIVCVQGINRLLTGNIPNLNKFPILADVVLNATLLSRGQANKLITTLFIDWYPCQAEGGCSLTRTPEIQKEACEWLESQFGPYIKAVEKEAKNGWLGGKRTDFRGRWKALYDAGVAGLLDI